MKVDENMKVCVSLTLQMSWCSKICISILMSPLYCGNRLVEDSFEFIVIIALCITECFLVTLLLFHRSVRLSDSASFVWVRIMGNDWLAFGKIGAKYAPAIGVFVTDEDRQWDASIAVVVVIQIFI